jgi:hypothetical protein
MSLLEIEVELVFLGRGSEGVLVGLVVLGGEEGLVESCGGIKIDRRAPRAWRWAVECRCL